MSPFETCRLIGMRYPPVSRVTYPDILIRTERRIEEQCLRLELMLEQLILQYHLTICMIGQTMTVGDTRFKDNCNDERCREGPLKAVVLWAHSSVTDV